MRSQNTCRCVSHETIFNKTNAVGAAASNATEGATIKELGEYKKSQGECFDNMEVWEEPAERVYMDMDGVMINSRKRMEGKVAVVWSNRELVRKDTYSLVDKRYMGSFSELERFYWDVTSEFYRRSGGQMDDVNSFVRGDGAPVSKALMLLRADIYWIIITYVRNSRSVYNHCMLTNTVVVKSVRSDKE